MTHAMTFLSGVALALCGVAVWRGYVPAAVVLATAAGLAGVVAWATRKEGP